MNCEQIETKLVSYLLKDLPEAEHEAVRKHLGECESCRASVRELEQTLDLLDGALAAPFEVPLALDASRRIGIYGTAPVKNKLLLLRPGLQLVAVLALLLIGAGLLLPSLNMAPKFAMTQADRTVENMELAQLETEEDFSVPRGQNAPTVVTARPATEDYEAPMVEDVLLASRGPAPEARQERARALKRLTEESAPTMDGTPENQGKSMLSAAGRSDSGLGSDSYHRDDRVADELKPSDGDLDGFGDFGSVNAVRGLAAADPVGMEGDKDLAGWGDMDKNFDPGLAKADAPLEELNTPLDGKRSGSRFYGVTSKEDKPDQTQYGKSAESKKVDWAFAARTSGGSGGGGNGRLLDQRKTELKDLPGDASEVDRVVGFDNALQEDIGGGGVTYAYNQQKARTPAKPRVASGPVTPAAPKVKRKTPARSAEDGSGLLAETEVTFGKEQTHMAWREDSVSENKKSAGLSLPGSRHGAPLSAAPGPVSRMKEGRGADVPRSGALDKESGSSTYTVAGNVISVTEIQYENEAATAVPDLPAEPLPTPVAAPGTSGQNGQVGDYLIQPGDTLSTIAKRKNTSVDELAKLNRLADPNAIRAGQKLALPGGEGEEKGQKLVLSLDDSDSRLGDKDESRERLARMKSEMERKQTRDRLEAALQREANGETTIRSEAGNDYSDTVPVPGDIPVTGRLFQRAEEADEKDGEQEREEVSEPVFRAYSFNPYIETKDNAFSTFSIDVDTAAYTLARRYMMEGRLPPPDAVRTEEFLNFFNYNYPAPKFGTFAVYSEAAPTPLGSGYLLKVGIKGKRIGREEQRNANLTFVIDTSGSMDTKDRLGLARKSLKLLVGKLNPQDQVAIVQYSSQSRLVLEHTPASQQEKIIEALDALQVSGSTHLEQGLSLGYQVAARVFDPQAINRVLLVSDGAANLGAASAEEILGQVESYRQQGIFCSIFGFGIGTYNDVMLETLANKGNGSYQFIDSEEEARRVFVDDLSATLNTIASDVKIQVEFNPERVQQYRQLGYENRQLTQQQFRDDTVDAGEVGSGQSVTALYEVHLQGDPNLPIGTVRVRYRNLDTGEVEEIARPISAGDVVRDFNRADIRFRLAAAVVLYAEKLRGTPYTDHLEYRDIAGVLRPVAMALELDPYVQELSRLVQSASSLPRAAE